MKRLILNLIGIVSVLTTSLFAQVLPPTPTEVTSTAGVPTGYTVTQFETKGGPSVDNMAPNLPVEVMMQGRQTVVDYLLRQVDYVMITYTGASVLQAESRYLSRKDLYSLGYQHAGSFSELVDAIAGTQFVTEIIPRPEGYYDVQVRVNLLDANGHLLFQGSGGLNIQPGIGDTLIATEFQPWIWINPNIALEFSNPIKVARWIKENWAGQQDYYPVDKDSKTIIVPSSILGNGYLAVADSSGHVSALNLKSGGIITGTKVVAMLGKIGSSDIRVIKNKETLEFDENQHFYLSDGQVYGRVPLTELVLDQKTKVAIQATASVWGLEKKMVAKRVTIKSVFVNEKGGGPVPNEFVVPIGYTVTLPPGIYHVIIEFDDVLDWDHDPNPKG